MLETTPLNQMVIDQIKQDSGHFQLLPTEISKVIIGQTEIINFIVLAILCRGHILLEGVPGVAKTTLIKATAKALGLKFNRIQFTPDLLPSDLIGTQIYNPKTQDFEAKLGPIFANLILADEINRAPAKVQAALLEAMQEQQVTIGSTTYHLDPPFLVFATQNPIEQEGTYRLPEAQIDRFLFKLHVKYPTRYEERELLDRSLNVNELMQVLSAPDILQAQQLVAQMHVDKTIKDYIVNIIAATRDPQQHKLADLAPYIQYGVGPRGTLALFHAAKAHAFMKKRHFVIPDDVKAVAIPVLRHRLLLTYQAEAENITSDVLISRLLNQIYCP